MGWGNAPQHRSPETVNSSQLVQLDVITAEQAAVDHQHLA
jgi:hypothetical protein